MHLLDNFIKQKFLEDISILINQYNIGQHLSPLGKLVQFLSTSEYFNEEIFEIYSDHYKRQFTILGILADKQELDKERQAFSLVKTYISRKNIKLNLSDIVNIYLSHIFRRIVITPEIERPSGLYFINPK